MDKIRAAVVGYGNIGKYVVESLIDAPDFEITGIVRRNTTEIPSRLKGFNVVNSVSQLKDTDVALLCTPTRSVEQFAMECLSLGISTVDSYDIHGGIVALRRSLDEAAKGTMPCRSYPPAGIPGVTR